MSRQVLTAGAVRCQFTACRSRPRWRAFPLAPETRSHAPTRPVVGKTRNRTYLNTVEAFAPFAAVVIIAHVSGKANSMTAFWTACFRRFRR
jgi:uncharacterized MAPEG superfamily protein